MDDIYWTGMGRAPVKTERESALWHLQKSLDKHAAMEDIVWSLLNAKEFVLRR